VLTPDARRAAVSGTKPRRLSRSHSYGYGRNEKITAEINYLLQLAQRMDSCARADNNVVGTYPHETRTLTIPGMSEGEPRELWSYRDDVLLKAWTTIYQDPLTPPLTFEVVNAAGGGVSVSASDLDPGTRPRRWWDGWLPLFPVTIHVKDVNGKGFSFSLPDPENAGQ
jgi:hypothetical protein